MKHMKFDDWCEACMHTPNDSECEECEMTKTTLMMPKNFDPIK